MSTSHQCQCPSCTPDAFPAFGERMGPRHFAVRFGDDRPGLRVLLDGERVLKCLEAVTGKDGWVLVFCQDPEVHRCRQCRDDACMEVRRGHVELVYAERGAAWPR